MGFAFKQEGSGTLDCGESVAEVSSPAESKLCLKRLFILANLIENA